MELRKENMYLNDGFGAPKFGFCCNAVRPIVEIGGRNFAIEQVGLKRGEFIVLLYEAWGRPESHAPMCTCGKIYMFYSFGKGIWHVDESYMDGFKSDTTAALMSDIVNSTIALFKAELAEVDARYGTHYSTATA